jgi:solute carrier family 25 phosphate transporter 23/24/25/41
MAGPEDGRGSQDPDLPPTPPPPSEKLSALDQFRAGISQPVVAAFCAGGVAGAVSRTVVSPLERLKILFQVQSAGRDAYKLSVGKALMKMWKEEGWRGFMRGNGTNCIRIVPYSAVQFGSYNFYKRVGTLRYLAWLGGWESCLEALSWR